MGGPGQQADTTHFKLSQVVVIKTPTKSVKHRMSGHGVRLTHCGLTLAAPDAYNFSVQHFLT